MIMKMGLMIQTSFPSQFGVGERPRKDPTERQKIEGVEVFK